MKNVITGGAGFIGSHLTEYLLRRGETVTILDDLSTGSLSNLAAVNNKAEFVSGSVLDSDLVIKTVKDADRIFHLAAAVGVRRIVEHPLESLRTNIHGTENVLEAARQANAIVLLASTSEIYGKNTSDRLSEDSDRILGSPLKSRWTYAAAKGIDESFARAYWQDYALRVAIVRLFNTVGPRQTGRYGMVLPNLVGQAIRNDPLTVFGDGQQTRCFSFVGDIVPAFVQLSETPEAYGQVFNLGGKREVSILELAERVIHLLGSRSTVQLVPYEEAYADGFEDMRRRVPDNTRAARLVNFDPTTDLDHIILEVAAAMQSGSDRTAAAPPNPLQLRRFSGS